MCGFQLVASSPKNEINSNFERSPQWKNDLCKQTPVRLMHQPVTQVQPHRKAMPGRVRPHHGHQEQRKGRDWTLPRKVVPMQKQPLPDMLIWGPSRGRNWGIGAGQVTTYVDPGPCAVCEASQKVAYAVDKKKQQKIKCSNFSRSKPYYMMIKTYVGL